MFDERAREREREAGGQIAERRPRPLYHRLTTISSNAGDFCFSIHHWVRCCWLLHTEHWRVFNPFSIPYNAHTFRTHTHIYTTHAQARITEERRGAYFGLTMLANHSRLDSSTSDTPLFILLMKQGFSFFFQRCCRVHPCVSCAVLFVGIAHDGRWQK